MPLRLFILLCHVVLRHSSGVMPRALEASQASHETQTAWRGSRHGGEKALMLLRRHAQQLAGRPWPLQLSDPDEAALGLPELTS